MCIVRSSFWGGLLGLLFLWQVHKGDGCGLIVSALGLALTNKEICIEVKDIVKTVIFMKSYSRGEWEMVDL